MKNHFLQFFRWILSPFLLKCYAGCLLGFILLITAFYLEENWRGAREWENTKAELAAKGETLDFDKLTPPPVPDEENFCSTPLIKKYLEERKRISNEPDLAKQEEMEKKSTIIQTIKKMSGFDPSAQNKIPNYKTTKYTLKQWRDYYMSNPAFAAAHPNISDAEAILLHFQEQKTEWKELAKAASLPHAQFGGDFSVGLSFDLVNGLALKTHSEFASKQQKAGMESLRIFFKLNQSVSNLPGILDHLINITGMRRMIHPIRYALQTRALDKANLDSLSSQLKSDDILKGYQRSLRKELQFFIGFMDSIKKFSTSHPKGWYDLNKSIGARLYHNYLFAAANTDKHLFNSKLVEKGESIATSFSSSNFSTNFAKQAFFSISSYAIKSAQAQADVDMTIIACELEKYYLNNKKYPSKLEELKADIPHDVMSGEPYHYQQTPGGRYKLWSVGWNGTDENGTLGYLCNNPDKNRLDPKEGDWIWSYEDGN